jgi:hypothetical protein
MSTDDPICRCGHPLSKHVRDLFSEKCKHLDWWDGKGACKCTGFVEAKDGKDS